MVGNVIIGTRDSTLAMWQTQWVASALRQDNPGLAVQVKEMKTKGDNISDVALAKIGDQGLFTKELELALLNGEIHLAVHSMKDLPTQLPAGLTIGAVCVREYPGDVLISKHGEKLDELKQGARIGTSSLRRRAQLLHYRPDLQMVDLRGNLTTRLRKLRETDLDAIVLAYAGIKRLGYENLISQRIPYSICLPAVGQGSIGVEIRTADAAIKNIVAGIQHEQSRVAIMAERAFLRRLEGGCQVPIGAIGRVENNMLFLDGVVADPHGKSVIRYAIDGPINNARELGVTLAELLLDRGAAPILTKIRQEFGLDGC